MPKWELILEAPYSKVFAGKEDPKYPPPCPSDVGSSVLLQVSSDKYIYVGIIINELEIKEPVKDFTTESGCRDTVESHIYTEKDIIDPEIGMKFPIKILKGKEPNKISIELNICEKTIKKYTQLLNKAYEPVSKQNRTEHTQLVVLNNTAIEIVVGDSKSGWSEAIRHYFDIISSKQYSDLKDVGNTGKFKSRDYDTWQKSWFPACTNVFAFNK
jgi:hypothetical protein